MAVQTATPQDPTVERDVLTIDDLMRLTGWGRTYTYNAAKTNSLPFPVLRSGRKYFISRRAYERWLAGETTPDTNDGPTA